MELHICTIGRWHKPQKDISMGLLKQMRPLAHRLNLRPITTHDIRASVGQTPAQQCQADTRQITKYLPPNRLCVALHREAKQCTSPQFAKRLQNWANCGKANLCFVIGGPNGLTRLFLEQADERLSLGPLLWSHDLARLMLLEQLWRAMALLCHHPYAKK